MHKGASCTLYQVVTVECVANDAAVLHSSNTTTLLHMAICDDVVAIATCTSSLGAVRAHCFWEVVCPVQHHERSVAMSNAARYHSWHAHYINMLSICMYMLVCTDSCYAVGVIQLQA